MKETRWHSVPLKSLYKNLESNENGLTTKEGDKRRTIYGFNEIQLERKISPIKIFINQFNSFLVFLLIIASAFSYVISLYGGETLIDSILILFIVLANGVFGFLQDYKAEKSIEKLKKMNIKKTKVIRDEKIQQILTRNLVPGDIILLEQGDKIPAGARIIFSKDLHIDESILTGESIPVFKKKTILEENTQLADRKNMLFAGTTITRGKARAIVTSIGLKTEVGKIAKEISQTDEKQTQFQIELNKLGKKIGYSVIFIIVIITIIQLTHSSDILKIFLTSIALSVAAIPEGLPAVVTLSLALGSQKMIKSNALVRKLGVVESLRAVDIICTDKTGTLTENKMTVRKIYFDKKEYDVTGTGYKVEGKFLHNKKEIEPKKLEKILLSGYLCNEAIFGKDEKGKKKYLGDPTEIALLVSAKKASVEKNYKRIDEIPFSSETKRMVTIHKIDNKIISYMKGAPEVVLELCNKIYEDGKEKNLNQKQKIEILKINEKFAKQALRVLAFAYSNSKSENNMIFLGLQAMMDPPRREIKESIGLAKKAGIRTIMITGDNKITAQEVAKEIGLKNNSLEGKDIDNRENELNELVEKVNVFSRVSPIHKVKILKALQENGHVVSMTGDGVNDAPALKNADVSISMGIRGTDIAKETSDIILLDDNYSTIVKAIKEGRTIFDNIRKFVNYLLSSNFAEVFVIFILSIFGHSPLTAVQLLWINLFTDGFPALALGIDPSAPDIMKRKPKNKKEGIINKQIFHNIVSVGSILTIVLISLYLLSPSEVAGTVVFTAFVIYEMIRISAIRYQEKLNIFSNKWLIVAMVSVISLQIILIYSPFAKLFNAVPLGIDSWILILIGGAVAFLMIILIDKIKIFNRKYY